VALVPVLHPAMLDVQIIVCILCLGVTLWWWILRHQKTATAAASASNRQHDNGCNNPNCLRCHSSSQHHIKAFQANATMLRRLVKLEPDLFEGMRKEIWIAIEDMERNFFEGGDGNIRPELFPSVRKLVHGCFQWWQTENSDATIKSGRRTHPVSSCHPAPTSPQEGQDPTVFSLPGLEAIPFHDASQCRNNCPCMRLWKSLPRSKNSPPITVTGDIEALRSNYPIIRKELLDFLSSNQHVSRPFKPFDPKVYTHASIDANQRKNSRKNANPKWSSIYLYQQGIRQSETCNTHFPQTTNILETKCPHIMAGKCGFGSIYFSRLERNTKVKEHCGPTNIRWRCHLPLVVPKNTGPTSSSCLCVGLPGVNETRVGWNEGVPILFDDSFLHSAVHHGESEAEANNDESSDSALGGARIVLIVDFWHPALSEADRTSLGVLYPPGS